MRTILAALCFMTGAAAPTLGLAQDLDGPEARLAWSMSFGGQDQAADYALTLAYRGPEAGAPALRIADWHVNDELGIARVAGVPVLARNYRTNQTEDPLAYGSSPLNWAWWIISGVAVTALVLNAADGDDDAPVTGTGSSN